MPVISVAQAASSLCVVFWLVVTQAFKHSFWLTALIDVGGTTLHELAHFIVGLLLLAKPVDVDIWPRRKGDNWVLGYVRFNNLTLFNAAFVSMAPLLLLFGLGALFWYYWAVPAFNHHEFIAWLAACYLTAGCINSGIPSSTDFKVGATSLLMYGLLTYAVWHIIRKAP